MLRSLILSAAVAVGLSAALAPAAQAQGYRVQYYSGYNPSISPYYGYYGTNLRAPVYSTYSYYNGPAYVPWGVTNVVPAPTAYPPTYLDPAYGYYYNVPGGAYYYYPAARSVYNYRGQIIYR